MKRLFRIALIMLAPTELAAVVLFSTHPPGSPDPVESAVLAYLRYQDVVAQPTGAAGSLGQIVSAANPAHFTPQLSQASFSSGTYYQTTHNYQTRRQSGLSATATPWPGELSDAGKKLRPLPYPPVSAWCVRVRASGRPALGVVFVAYHQDLYNAAWVVHEPAAETIGQLRSDLSSLGCDLALDN